MSKKPIQPQDKYVLRLPDGLRDRIKAYADHQGRSMNSEIVRILEREFPEPWPIESRVSELLGLVEILKEGVTESVVDKLNEELHATLRGIISGRVKGVSDEIRTRVHDKMTDWEIHQMKSEHDRYTWGMDEEELDAINRGEDPFKV